MSELASVTNVDQLRQTHGLQWHAPAFYSGMLILVENFIFSSKQHGTRSEQFI